jgi:DNA-binding transcriptional LysR family regulator
MLDVETRELQVFLTLADELHFGRTGERLNVTPSRISQIVRTLETRLGGALFDRTSRRVRLTPLGEQLRRTVGPLYDALQAAIDEARHTARGVAGVLRLGMYTPINGGPHLVEIIKTFEAGHPTSAVEITDTGFAIPQLEWLRRGKLDLLATRLPIHDPELTIGPILSREARILIVGVDHPLAARTSVDVEDLADHTVPHVPTLPSETMAVLIPSTTPSGQPIPQRTVRTMGEAVTLAALGEIVHPTVTSFVHHYRHPGITSVPLTGLPHSETALVWLTRHSATNVLAFADTAAAVLRVEGTGPPPTHGETGPGDRSQQD